MLTVNVNIGGRGVPFDDEIGSGSQSSKITEAGNPNSSERDTIP